MMEAFGLTEKAHSSVEGVAAEPFVFNGVATYVLYKDTQLTQSTRWGLLSLSMTTFLLRSCPH